MELNRNDDSKKREPKKNLPPAIIPSFTKREVEVIVLLCRDLSAKEIAYVLHITTWTVQGYKKSIKRKIGSPSVVGIVIYAIRTKIFQITTVLYFFLESDYWQTFVDLLTD